MTRIANVNTHDIRGAIELGCLTMSNVFNADDRDIPFFGSQVRPEALLSFSSSASESHIPGRHLNALLNAEDAVGIEIDEGAVKKHTRAAFFSYSGPVPLPLNRSSINGPLENFMPHSVREGFHALYALARFRASSKACELAEASIDAIMEYWNPATGWDFDYLEGRLGLRVDRDTFIIGLARSIGPLVKYYRATGYGPALHLAVLLKEKAVSEFFTDEGLYDRTRFGTHTHSTTCVMSSLAQFADLTFDSHLMQRVKAFYDRGLWEICDELGWVIENSADSSNPDRGEVNNTGDIVETALILGRWGYTECYEDVERILRGHLLPSQVRDVSFIVDPPNPRGQDGKRAVAQRHIGAFGFPAPYGHEPIGCPRVSFNMDIVGGAVASLCEAYRDVTRFDKAGHWVNLLFDNDTPHIHVQSPYTHSHLRVRTKRSGPLFIRIPSWVEKEKVRVQGVDGAPLWTRGYLFLANPPVNRVITVQFQLSHREITLYHRTRDIRVRLHGDEVVAMDNFGADLTFFDPIG